jgi:hypothetical protein
MGVQKMRPPPHTVVRCALIRASLQEGAPFRLLGPHTNGIAEACVRQGLAAKSGNSGLTCHVVREQS